MLLLNFAVRNHRSLRDDTTLSLLRSSLKTLSPRGGETWRQHTFTVAGIFGPNASGKSSVVDALHYVVEAVRLSASTWLASNEMPRAAFLLGGEAEATSEFTVDFVLDETRYEYTFEIDTEGVVSESLYDLPGIRRRQLLRRNVDGVRVHSSLAPIGPVAKRELALSRAMRLDHPELGPIAEAITEGIDIVPLSESSREYRLARIPEALATGALTRRQITTLLQIADIGITDVEVIEEQVPPHVIEFVRRINEIITEDNSPQESDTGVPHTVREDLSETVARSLAFSHRGDSGANRFSITQESAGTIAWLALSISAVEALRNGTVLCADEIDSSLHPHLVDMLIGFFEDPDTNPKGAQLIFTSHDTYLLSPLSETGLQPEQVWFTEKDSSGATSLYSLADFRRHKDANLARRYLSGRYGAVPSPAPHLLQGVLAGATAQP